MQPQQLVVKIISLICFRVVVRHVGVPQLLALGPAPDREGRLLRGTRYLRQPRELPTFVTLELYNFILHLVIFTRKNNESSKSLHFTLYFELYFPEHIHMLTKRAIAHITSY